MSNFYNIFGDYVTNEDKVEHFANEKKEEKKETFVKSTDRIQELSSLLKSGEIKEEEIKNEIAELKKLDKEGKLSETDKKLFNDVVKTSIRLSDGLNLIGNLELGGMIKAKGFYLMDGTKVKEIVKEKDKLAVPVDSQGNINLKAPKGKKMTIDKTDVKHLNVPKDGRISFGEGQDNDPYHLRKIGNADSNHLRLTLNDNNNESLQIWGDSCKGDKCAPDGGNFKHGLYTNGNAKHTGDIIMNGGNNWIIHTPDITDTLTYIAPSKTKGKEDWNWSKQTNLRQMEKLFK